MGYSNAAFFSGFGFGPLMGGTLAAQWGMDVAFITMGVLNLLAFSIAVVWLPRSDLRKSVTALPLSFLDMRRSEEAARVAGERRSLIGSGDRSQRIRTYNFPQNRLTDHRIGLTLHNLPAILQGELDDLIGALAADERAKMLEEAAG